MRIKHKVFSIKLSFKKRRGVLKFLADGEHSRSGGTRKPLTKQYGDTMTQTISLPFSKGEFLAPNFRWRQKTLQETSSVPLIFFWSRKRKQNSLDRMLSARRLYIAMMIGEQHIGVMDCLVQVNRTPFEQIRRGPYVEADRIFNRNFKPSFNHLFI